MTNSVEIPGTVFGYPFLQLDEEDAVYKPYALYINRFVRDIATSEGACGQSASMDGDFYVYEADELRFSYLDSPWGNDHYYVHWNGQCVYHCQDTPGRMTIQEHIPGRWLLAFGASENGA